MITQSTQSFGSRLSSSTASPQKTRFSNLVRTRLVSAALVAIPAPRRQLLGHVSHSIYNFDAQQAEALLNGPARQVTKPEPTGTQLTVLGLKDVAVFIERKKGPASARRDNSSADWVESRRRFRLECRRNEPGPAPAIVPNRW